MSKKSKLPKNAVDSQTRAAAMANATRGRSRTFKIRRIEDEEEDEIIKEGLDEYREDRLDKNE